VVYGYSVGWGRADHATSAALLAKAFPAYAVTHNDDGY